MKTKVNVAESSVTSCAAVTCVLTATAAAMTVWGEAITWCCSISCANVCTTFIGDIFFLDVTNNCKLLKHQK